MLPAAHRLRRSEDFVRTVRLGRRQGSRHLVAHLLSPEPASAPSPPMSDLLERPDAVRPTAQSAAQIPRVGFVVSKAVGTAVVRTRVKRRLRAVVAVRLDRLPPGGLLVVRANPSAAHATTAELTASLERALGRLLAPPHGGRPPS